MPSIKTLQTFQSINMVIQSAVSTAQIITEKVHAEKITLGLQTITSV